MPHIDHHAPGGFSWMELGTTDQNAAKQFYGSLLGWTSTDSPMGPNAYYTMFQLEGRNVAGGYTLMPDQVANHIPPHWMLYIAVTSADEAAKRAAELGGRVMAGPFDVFTYGRMAIIADPTGAVFGVWEPKTHTGIGIARQPGTLCWADLSTPDAAAAAGFYSGLFGYTFPPGEGGYLHIQNGEHFIGGIPPAAHRQPNSPPHWLLYLQVEDCDASAAKAKELGASVYVPPMTMEGIGRWAVLADPQGAVFSLFQPLPRK